MATIGAPAIIMSGACACRTVKAASHPHPQCARRGASVMRTQQPKRQGLANSRCGEMIKFRPLRDGSYLGRNPFVAFSEDGETGDSAVEGDSAESIEPDVVLEADEELDVLERIKAAVDDEALIDEIEAEFIRLSKVVEDLEAKAGPIQEQLTVANDQALRLNADFDNFRKRTVREKDQLSQNSKSAVLEELLPVIDAFELAKDQVKASTEGEERVANSYNQLYKQMGETLENVGLVNVPGVGAIFNPELHDAIMREDSTTEIDGSILQEFRKGFMFKDRLLRPSMVKVAANDAMPAPRVEKVEEEAA